MTFALMPDEVIYRQVAAYNHHDLEEFLTFWADDVEVFDHPNSLRFSGLVTLRERYAELFRDPDLNAEILHRRVIDSFVIDQELVTRNFPGGLGTVEVTAIYQLQGSKIRRVWFLVGEPRLSAGE